MANVVGSQHVLDIDIPTLNSLLDMLLLDVNVFVVSGIFAGAIYA